MKKIIFILLLGILISGMWSCGITRTERDVYTISIRDTITNYFMKNAPGERDNGVVYPSSRTFKSERYLLQTDSVVERKYPDFIRMGVFESVGLMMSGDKEYGLGTGLFGVFREWDQDYINYRGDNKYTFTGGLYRIGIGEWRLRWFRDAKNWTYGTSLIEGIFPDARFEHALVSMAPIYVRKRWYLKETIPYICLTPAFGIGWWPSQYMNASISLDVGSLSGVNFRAYLGFAAGQNTEASPQVKESRYTSKAQTVATPYAGIGISLLDFHNLVPETETEWKDHEHSGWDIGLIQLGFIGALSGNDNTPNSDNSWFNNKLIRLLNAHTALPVLNNKIFIGTSLLNVIAFDKNNWGAGILPIRAGYFETLLLDELTTEPFVEYNYFPSQFFNIGNRVNLRILDELNISLILGYASGETSEAIGNQVINDLGNPLKFSGAYVGFMVNFMDHIFFPEKLRYNKKTQD